MIKFTSRTLRATRIPFSFESGSGFFSCWPEAFARRSANPVCFEYSLQLHALIEHVGGLGKQLWQRIQHPRSCADFNWPSIDVQGEHLIGKWAKISCGGGFFRITPTFCLQDESDGWEWPLQRDSEGKGFLAKWSIDAYNTDDLNPRWDERVLFEALAPA